MLFDPKRFFARNSAQPTRLHRPRVSLPSWPAAVYAIGDIHGCLGLLNTMLEYIIADGRTRAGRKLIICLGDYIDRGPDASGVLSRLMVPLPTDFSLICLAGNHEVMMLDHLAEPRRDDNWLSLGGTETLMSYGVNISSYLAASQKHRAAILHTHVPLQHIQFLQDLPILVSIPGMVFVHAGLRPEVPIEEQDDRDLLWMRPREGMPNKLPTLIVHGHTPVDEINELDGRINIDTGAFATGHLAGLRLIEGERPHFLVVRATQDA